MYSNVSSSLRSLHFISLFAVTSATGAVSLLDASSCRSVITSTLRGLHFPCLTKSSRHPYCAAISKSDLHLKNLQINMQRTQKMISTLLAPESSQRPAYKTPSPIVPYIYSSSFHHHPEWWLNVHFLWTFHLRWKTHPMMLGCILFKEKLTLGDLNLGHRASK